MPVAHLDHVNLRTRNISGTAGFYVRVLGFRYDGPRPFGQFVRNWLYDAAGHPVIHLRELAPIGDGSGSVDHIAFRCTDRAATLAAIAAEGIEHAEQDNHEEGITQMFVTDPNGVLVELNFELSK